MPINSLYIHVPFCDHICIYCDFYKMIAKEKSIEKYFDYLLKELEIKKEYMKEIKTIYIGGGTPSCVKTAILRKLFIKLSKLINLNSVIEFTMECNPKDVNDELISLFKEFNVNRISLGAQSLDDNKLMILNRNHTHYDIYKAINLLKNNNITNISCDLIYGLQNDTYELLEKDILKLIDLDVKHISCYTLIIEEKTILEKMIKHCNYKPLDDDIEADIYEKITNFLSEKGYERYEISNYSKKGYESIHNMTYWMNDNYLGVGAGASYFIDNVQYKNITNLNKYYEGIDKNNLVYSEMNILSKSDLMYDEIMLKLRTRKGIDINEFYNKFNVSLLEINNINKHLSNGNLILDDNNIYVNPKQMYIVNSILTDILSFDLFD